MTGPRRDGPAPGARFRGSRAGLDGDRRGGGEQVVVPPAEFASYYGRPIVKAPVWRQDIPSYLFTGGLAAGTALLAAGADLTGRAALRRSSRLASLGALGASTYFLINDLGRPQRFHHMLRVLKPTSPLSVGTWILAGFGPMAGLAALSEIASALPRCGALGLAHRLLPPTGRAAGLAAAALAPALATYTGVLLANTAMPSWHDAYRDLPFVFGGSALASAAGLGLIMAPTAECAPARRLAVAGAVIEALADQRMKRMGLTGEPYRKGRAGKLMRSGQALLAVGAVGAVVGRRSRALSALSGAALVAASLMTRFGVFEAGVVSALDPKYTVLPQREQLARRAGKARADAAGRSAGTSG